MYKGALVGCGHVACQAHVPAWRQAAHFQIIAAVDPEPERLAQIKTLLPGVCCYAHLETLLEHEELDFLDICTPPAMHDQIILRACAQGVHVLCEKPLTCSAGAFQQIAAAATAGGALIFPVHNWKYAPLFQVLKGLLAAGEVGRPTYVELTTLRTKPAGTDGWRTDPKIAGGGILMDHGWHAFYLLLFLLGETPQSIAARLERRRWRRIAVEDTATCEVTFPQAQARIHLTWAAQQRQNAGVVRGTKGEIRFADARLVVQSNHRAPREILLPEALSAGSYHADWFAALLPDFHAALEEPWRHRPSLQEAEICLRLTLLAYHSAACNAQPLAYTQRLQGEMV
jgi:predicted dehydrogenase